MSSDRQIVDFLCLAGRNVDTRIKGYRSYTWNGLSSSPGAVFTKEQIYGALLSFNVREQADSYAGLQDVNYIAQRISLCQ